MKRRVIQIADSTQLISLPRQWTKLHEIKKGDELDVIEDGNKVIVSASQDVTCVPVKIDVRGFDEHMVHRAVSALYKIGYDDIQVTFATSEEGSLIQNAITNEFIGFEVQEKTEHSICARKVSEIDYKEIPNMIKRTFMFLINIAQENLKVIEKGKYDDMEYIQLREVQINKLTEYCRRALNKGGNIGVKHPMPVYYLIEDLEKIGDCYHDLSSEIVEAKSAVSVPLKEALEGICELLRMALAMYSHFNIHHMNKFVRTRDEIRDSLSRYSKNDAQRSEITQIVHISKLLDMVFNLNGPILASRM